MLLDENKDGGRATGSGVIGGGMGYMGGMEPIRPYRPHRTP